MGGGKVRADFEAVACVVVCVVWLGRGNYTFDSSRRHKQREKQRERGEYREVAITAVHAVVLQVEDNNFDLGFRGHISNSTSEHSGCL